MNLREARFRSGKTQWKLVTLTNICQTRISLLENNFVRPSLKERFLISEALGFAESDIDWLEEVHHAD